MGDEKRLGGASVWLTASLRFSSPCWPWFNRGVSSRIAAARPAPAARPARLDAFQRLALATTATTYLLILVGGLVRAAGAGLGCPDWPKCFGLWIPPTSAAELPSGFDAAQFNAALTWIEYLNRLLGVATGFLILATLVAALRRHRRTPRVLWPVVLAFLGVGFQGWLGGRVVAHGLAPWIVTAHLVMALVIVSLLLYATVSAFYPRGRDLRLAPGRVTLGRTAWALVGLTLVQVALGTRVRGALDLLAGDLSLARDERLAAVGAPDLVHRSLALLVLGAALALFAWTVRAHRGARPLVQAAAAVFGLAAAQVAAGIALAYLGLPPAAQVAHLSLASLLLGAETLLALLAGRWSAG
jgi:cytochrome c oxidase assembly protein subunit 15